MSRRDDLIALRDTVQAGKWWDDEGIAKAYCAECGLRKYSSNVHRAMSGSVDAALAFLAAVLPGWQAMIVTHAAWADIWKRGDTETTNRPIRGRAETPARALLLATLNALIADADT